MAANRASRAERVPRTGVGRMVRLAGRYFTFNLSASMAYAGSFIIQVFGMALNNAAFIVFWYFLFQRIGGQIAGYDMRDVMFLWAMTAAGFGTSVVLFGNSQHLSRIIYHGELDVYLLQPKPVLANLMLSRTVVSGWGDIAYGLILFAATQTLTLSGWALFVLFTLLMAGVLTAMRVIYHSATFFFGNAEDFALMASELTVSFTLYPGSIFKGPITVVLYTLVPAGLIAHVPVDIFRSFSLPQLLIVIAADVAIIAIAAIVFQTGLRRYESGNRIGTRT